MRIWTVAALAATLLIGGTAALAQDGTTTNPSPRVVVPERIIDVQYGTDIFEVAASDGPVVAYVTERNESDAGVEIRGVLVLHDDGGYRVAGEFVDPAPAVYASSRVGDVLVLALPAVSQ